MTIICRNCENCPIALQSIYVRIVLRQPFICKSLFLSLIANSRSLSFHQPQHNFNKIYQFVESNRDTFELLFFVLRLFYIQVKKSHLKESIEQSNSQILAFIKYYQSWFIIFSINYINQIMIRNIMKWSFCTSKISLQNIAKMYIKDQNTFQLKLTQDNTKQRIFLDIPRDGTLADVTKILNEKFEMTDMKYYCNLTLALNEQTPISTMINRYFYVISKEYSPLTIEGQYFDYGKDQQIVDGIETLEFPVVYKREIQNYFIRINRWFKFKTGISLQNQNAKLSSDEASDIFVQALIDPQPQQRNILAIQSQWQKLYWKLQQLKRKKQQADQVVLKRVKRKMAFGLVLLTANIGFIWSGTYIFYSWDIIQPLAYFISSLGGIVLAAQFFKLGRPYSNYAYQQYLIQKYSPKIYQQMGFDEQQLHFTQNQLIQYESIIKDHFLKRL